MKNNILSSNISNRFCTLINSNIGYSVFSCRMLNATGEKGD